MRRLAAVGFWPAVLLCLLHAQVASANEAGVPEANSSPAPIPEFDDALKKLRSRIWDLYGGTAVLGTDNRGRTVSDDLRDFVLTSQTEARLRQLRVQAQIPAEPPGAAASGDPLVEAKQVLATESAHLDFIGQYWGCVESLKHHHALWQHLADQLPEPAWTEGAQRIRLLSTALSDRVQPPFEADRMHNTYKALVDAYNRERQNLADAVSAERARSSEATPARDRQRPCPEPASKTSGGADAKRVGRTRAVYPATARRDGIQGRITVETQVEPSGCAVRARIAQSSGSPELDDAALDAAEQIEFLPAEKDGHAVAVWTRVRFVFRLED